MTECAIMSPDGSTVLRRVGVELSVPLVKNNRIIHVSLSEQFLMFCVGSPYAGIRFGVTQKQAVWLNIFLIFLREDFKQLEIIYRNSSKPAYMQLLFDYLGQHYSFSNVNFWVNKVKVNFQYVNMVLANCHNDFEVNNLIPQLVKYLEKH